jgi:hypothetical protein
VRLGVGGEGADGASRQAVERGFAQGWVCGWGGCGGGRGRWRIGIGFWVLRVVLGLRLLREAGVFGPAPVEVGQGGYVGADDTGGCVS